MTEKGEVKPFQCFLHITNSKQNYKSYIQYINYNYLFNITERLIALQNDNTKIEIRPHIKTDL